MSKKVKKTGVRTKKELKKEDTEKISAVTKFPVPQIGIRLKGLEFPWFKEMEESINQLIENMVPFNKQLEETFKELGRISQVNLNLPKIPYIKEMDEAFKEIAEFMKYKNEKTYKDFELNWLSFLPVGTAKEIYEMHKEGRDEELWDMFKKTFGQKETIESLIAQFEESDIFKPRMQIIKDALNAHLEGKYTLSIPVLLTQVEGILWDIANIKEGISFSKKNSRTSSMKSVLTNTSLKNYLFPNFIDYYTKKIYQENSRHGIMHGRSISYDSQEDSIKTILMLRVLLDYCLKLK